VWRPKIELSVAVAIGIVLVWATSTIGDVLSATYSPPEGVTTIALAAATFLFGNALRKENREHNDDDGTRPH
jgi:hypothetical protein